VKNKSGEHLMEKKIFPCAGATSGIRATRNWRGFPEFAENPPRLVEQFGVVRLEHMIQLIMNS
jgi:hypothetical protein